MRITAFILMLLAGITATYSQKAITLRECYEMASKKTALAGEKDAYSKLWQLKDDNFTKNWLPNLDANANVAYNSDVVDFNSAFSSVPALSSVMKPMPKDQYKLTLEINQVIYDGGATRGARAIAKADLGVSNQETEVDLYKIRGQLNGYFFTLMLLSKQKELLNAYLELIDKRIKSLRSAADNGVVLKSDVDILTSEKIRIEQQLSENEIKKVSFALLLSDLTGLSVEANSELIMPQVASELNFEISRPELKVLDLRKDQLDAGLELIKSKRMPKAFGFATLGYGSPPGQDFFNDKFDTYYIVGAGIKWNIFDWNKVKNEKQEINIQKDIIENRKNDLSDNLKRMLQAKKAEILSLESLISKDSTLIDIRKRITVTSESQYENGTATATDYLNELNSEKQAMINYEIHKINLSLSRIEYLNISGKEIE
jgi:outer membrane protein TolC